MKCRIRRESVRVKYAWHFSLSFKDSNDDYWFDLLNVSVDIEPFPKYISLLKYSLIPNENC